MGMVLFSLIKMFKEPKLFLLKNGDSVRQRYLSPAIVVTDMSHTSTLAHIPVHASTHDLSLGVHAYSKRAWRLTNQAVDTHARTRRGHTQRLSHTLHLGGMWRIL